MHVHSSLCPNGDLLLTSVYLPGIHAYPAELLRMYLEHEAHLRELLKGGKNFDFAERPVPAGIDTFVSIWNEDPHCLYGFSTVDPNLGTITPSERPPPPAELLYPALLRKEAERDLFKLTLEERSLLERLKIDAAMRQADHSSKSRRSYESREARRQGKARAGMLSPAMRKVTAAVASSLELRHQEGLLGASRPGTPSNRGSPVPDILAPLPLDPAALLGPGFTQENTPGASGAGPDVPMFLGEDITTTPKAD